MNTSNNSSSSSGRYYSAYADVIHRTVTPPKFYIEQVNNDTYNIFLSAHNYPGTSLIKVHHVGPITWKDVAVTALPTGVYEVPCNEIPYASYVINNFQSKSQAADEEAWEMIP